MSEVKPKFLSEKHAAAYLSLSNKTLQRYRTRGGGPSFCKLGGRVVYAIEDLSTWAMSNRHDSTSSYAEV